MESHLGMCLSESNEGRGWSKWNMVRRVVEPASGDLSMARSSQCMHQSQRMLLWKFNLWLLSWYCSDYEQSDIGCILQGKATQECKTGDSVVGLLQINLGICVTENYQTRKWFDKFVEKKIKMVHFSLPQCGYSTLHGLAIMCYISWCFTLHYITACNCHTSSFLVTALRAAGSRFDAARTSLNWASFFSNISAKAPSFFSSNRFFKLLFCWTSCTALTNLLYNSSRSVWI